jgi:hypothetical protein
LTGTVLFALALAFVGWCASIWYRSPPLTTASYGAVTAAQGLLHNATEQGRASILRSIIDGSGERCGEVIKNTYQGTTRDGRAFWTATCHDGQSFVVRMSGDRAGSTRVIDCIDVRAIAGIECGQAFK